MRSIHISLAACIVGHRSCQPVVWGLLCGLDRTIDCGSSFAWRPSQSLPKARRSISIAKFGRSLPKTVSLATVKTKRNGPKDLRLDRVIGHQASQERRNGDCPGRPRFQRADPASHRRGRDAPHAPQKSWQPAHLCRDRCLQLLDRARGRIRPALGVDRSQVALAIPTVRKTWPRNGIDFWILARLEAEGLKPSPEADR